MPPLDRTITAAWTTTPSFLEQFERARARTTSWRDCPRRSVSVAGYGLTPAAHSHWLEDQLFRGNRLLDARKCAAAAREFADARATGPDERADLSDPVLARIWREVLEFKDEQLASCDEAPEL